MTTQVQNPFAVTTAATEHTTGGIVESKSQREISEVQAMVVMAKQFPRNPIQAVDKILNACTRQTLAETAVYSYPRGGQMVEGASIRLAEVLAQNWGNMDFGVREISQANGESIVEAYAWDLETNVRKAQVFTAPHKRFTKRGTQILTDPRDIYELVANQGSRRLRSCILQIIPSDVTEAALNQCGVTLSTHADITPETIKKMLEKFAQFGVDAEAIQTRYQIRIDAIRPAQFIELRKIYNSLKDGISKPDDWFVLSQKANNTSDLNDIIAQGETQKNDFRQTENIAPEPSDKIQPDEMTFTDIVNQIRTGDLSMESANAQYIFSAEQQAELDAL